MTDNTGMGSAIGTMIGLGIGVVVAKKLTDVVKEETEKKQKKAKPVKVARDWVQKETGGWD